MLPDHIMKYPRTPHLPFSPGATSDDKWISQKSLESLKTSSDLLVTEKMDGGNITFYRDYFHGRSIDSGVHAWEKRTASLWGQVRYEIPDKWRISGESMYARRSVSYEDLPGVFMVFGIWDETNTLLSWDDTQEWADLLGLPVVPVLYRGNDYEDAISAWKSMKNDQESEGFVLRDAGRIHYDDFENKVAKYVRKNHVRTRSDWRHRDDFELNTFL